MQDSQKTETYNTVKLNVFIDEYGDQLTQNIINRVKPVHNPLNPVGVDEYTQKICLLLRQPYPSQSEVIKALAKGIYQSNLRSMILCGEMGVGKSLIASVVPFLSAKPIRTIIVCPPHLVRKWINEIKITVTGAKVINLNGRDCIKILDKIRREGYSSPSSPEYYVISRERLKAGYIWNGVMLPWERYYTNETVNIFDEATGVDKGKEKQPHFLRCPKCWGDLIREKEKNEIVEPVTLANLNCKKLRCTNPVGYRVYDGDKLLYRKVPLKWSDMHKHRIEDENLTLKSVYCDESLWCSNNTKVRRFMPAEFIKQYLRDFWEFAIYDEVHELKAKNSNQGHAFGMVSSVVDNTLSLTGTLMGGYADDLFYILFRTDPQLMLKNGFHYGEETLFMERYGVLEKITYLDDDNGNDNRTGKGKKNNTIVKRKPGVSPVVIPKFLLDRTVFLKLSDVSEGLPPYEEFVVSLKMNAVQKHAYDQLQEGFKDLIEEFKRSNSIMGLVSKMLQSLLSYPDSCVVRGEDISIKIKDDDGNVTIKAGMLKAPKLNIKRLPKEKDLLDIIKQEKANNRRVLVYVNFTGEKDIQPRIKDILAKSGINSVILKSTIKSELREEWIKKQVEENDIDVLICNPELVKTGLDLIDFPTIVFFQIGYRIDTLRQASRRSWRLGQPEPVKVFFLTYEKSMQSMALALIAEKLDCALTVEGDLVDKGLAALSESTDSLVADLLKGLLSGKSFSNLSAEAAWANFRKKEIASDLALGDSEKTAKADMIEAPVDKKKQLVDTKVESLGNRIIKVTLIESKKKKTAHLEVSKDSLDQVLKDKKDAVIQYCLF